MLRFWTSLVVGLLACVLAGCALNTQASAPEPLPLSGVIASPTASSTPRPSPSPYPTPVVLTPAIFPPPSPTPKAMCAAKAGQVVTESVESEVLNYPIDMQLYLPPCYAASAQRYPVLYIVHGLNFTEDQWPRLGIVTATNKLIASGQIAPLIIVMPRDRRDERFDPALVEDLVPYIDAHYRTQPERLYRAIGGLSRGAGWAVHIGLRYPELFGRIGLHSPAVFYGDENNVLQYGRTLIKTLPAADFPAVYIDIGEDDAQIVSARWLDQIFTWFKVKHTYIVRSGNHSEKYWSANIEEYMRFYAGAWLVTPVPSPTPTFR